MKKSKRIIIVVAVLIVLFSGLNIFWYAYREYRYNPLIENIPENYGIRIVSIDGYSYSVTKPGYLEFKGNLSLTDEENPSGGLIIWPEFPKGYTVAVTLPDGETNVSVYIDADGNYLPEKNSKNRKELYDANYDTVIDLITRANNMWGLNNG